MHSPPYPNAHLFIHPACIYNVPDRNGRAGEIKAFTSISETRHTGSMEKEGNRNYPNGDLTKEVSHGLVRT